MLTFSSEHLQAQRKKTEEFRREILLKSRTLVLHPILSQWHHYFSVQESCMRFVFAPHIVMPPTIQPITRHGAEKLLKYLLAHPNQLVTGLVQSQTGPLFQFLTTSAIPAVFGFFSSEEHIRNAVWFYLIVIGACNASTACEILSPFFQAAAMFPFFESIFTDFMLNFLYDDDWQEFGREYMDNLCLLVKANTHLIPSSHRSILKVMKEQFGFKVCADFAIDLIGIFIVRFIGKQHRSESCSHRINALISELRQSDRHRAMIVQGFLHGESFFEVPSMYNPCDDSCLFTYISVGDLQHLMDMVSRVGQLPSRLAQLNFGRLPYSAVFRCSFSGRVKVPEAIKMIPLFGRQQAPFKPIAKYDFAIAHSVNVPEPEFQDYIEQKTADMIMSRLETYLEDELLQQGRQKWFNILCAYEHKLFFNTVVGSAKNVRSTNIDEGFLRLATCISTCQLKQEQFFTILQANSKMLFRGKETKFSQVDRCWSEFTASQVGLLRQEELVFKAEKAKLEFLKAVALLDKVDLNELSFSFKMLLRFVAMLSAISEIEHVKSPQALIACGMCLSGAPLLRFYLIIARYVMNSHVFQRLVSRSDIKKWLLFERVILMFLQHDQQLRTSFMSAYAILNGHHPPRSLSVATIHSD